MEEITVESVFGVKAGIVWEVLNKNGPSTLTDIVKSTNLRRELVYGALGWLGRENKILWRGMDGQLSSHYDHNLVIVGSTIKRAQE